MKNRYPAKCFKCRKKVETGKGEARLSNGTWVVEHPKCITKPLNLKIIEALPSFPAADKQSLL